MKGGGPLLPIHWGTFDLAPHRWDQPIEVLTRLAGGRGARLLVPRHGDPVEPARAGDVEPWWREVSELHGPLERGADGEAASSTEEDEPLD